MKAWIKFFCVAFFEAVSPVAAFAAVSIPFTVDLSEVVTVNTGGGAPRIAVDVGGITRYASYTSGTGTSALTFTYDAVLGDVDLDGVTLSSPIELNGGTIKDTAGNDAALTFTPPNTTGVKVNYPSLGMDFIADADGRYTLNGTVYNNLPSFLTATGGTFSRASIGTYYNSTGVLQTASAGQPRFDYDPVTLQPKGILIEESRTNLKTNSGNPSLSTLVNAIVSSNTTIAPDNTTIVSGIETTTTTAQHYVAQSIAVTAGQVLTTSFFAKSGNSSGIQIAFGSGGFGSEYVNFNLNTGTVSASGGGVTSFGVTPVGNGWYRCWATATASFSGSAVTFIVSLIENDYTKARVIGYTGTQKYIFLWGLQFEQGTFPTSYIPTTTAAVTRAADALTLLVALWSNNGDETIFASASTVISQANWSSLFVYDGSYTNNRYLLLGSNGAIVTGYSGIPNVGTANVALNGSVFKAAGSFGPTTTSSVLNGGTVASGGSASNSTNSNATIGGGNGLYLNGALRGIKYYPLRINDTQLQLMTQ